MSLNDVVVTFRLPSPVTVTRRQPGTYDKGRLVPDPAPVVLTLNTTPDDAVSSVPFSGQTTLSLPEGQSAENVRIIYSKTILVARSETTPGDLVDLADGQYEVFSVKDWSGSVGDGTQDCWECMAARQGVP